jgi:hypothetical protein
MSVSSRSKTSVFGIWKGVCGRGDGARAIRVFVFTEEEVRYDVPSRFGSNLGEVSGGGLGDDSAEV